MSPKQPKEDRIRTNIHVSRSLWQQVRIRALEQHMNVQEFITKALEAAVKEGK